MTFFDFEMEDLRYNHNGKMSPYQKRRFFTGGLTSFLLIAVSGALGSIIIMTLRPVSDPCLWLSVSILGSMILGLISYNSLTRPVKAGVVQSLVGTLGKSPNPTMRPVFYIGNKSFVARQSFHGA
ncbi:MAG: hypothetical protein HXY35_05180 [Chloroflexi bacterium]|nr:hypothetical protein [Chloroflexota bacterium]